MPVPSEHGVLAINDLRAVVAPADDDVWAVGGAVLHWDGNRWRHVPAPAGSYWGISSSGPSDVWAVGTTADDELEVIHWDGSKWKRIPFVPSPRPGPIVHGNSVTLLNQRLYAVYAFAEDNVWVVGDWGDANGDGIDAHWDGKRWTSYPIPDGNFAHLQGLAAVSRDVLWAAGPLGSLVEWRNRKWRVKGVTPNIAYPIAVRGAQLWGMSGLHNNVLAKWEEGHWASVDRRPADEAVNGLAVAPDGSFWAVGLHTGDKVAHRSLMIHYRCAP
jgi:hypothetical protein